MAIQRRGLVFYVVPNVSNESFFYILILNLTVAELVIKFTVSFGTPWPYPVPEEASSHPDTQVL
jgi:hypothetical protein